MHMFILYYLSCTTTLYILQVPFLSEDAKLRGESNTPLVVKMMKHIFIANLLGLPGAYPHGILYMLTFIVYFFFYKMHFHANFLVQLLCFPRKFTIFF